MNSSSVDQSDARDAKSSVERRALPDTLPGHWATAEGREMAEAYACMSRDDLAMHHLTDLELANGVFMADRYDLNLISYQTAAKERIRWLSARLAMALSAQSSGPSHG